MPKNPEFPITDAPVLKLNLPPDEETARDYENSGDPRLRILAVAFFAVVAAGLIVIPK